MAEPERPESTESQVIDSSLLDYYRRLTPVRTVASCAWSGGDAPAHCELSRDSALLHRKLRALSVIASLLSGRDPQRDKLLKILAILRRDFELLRGTVMLLSVDGQRLRVEAMRRDGNRAGDDTGTYRRGEGINGQVLETGCPAVIPDIRREPDFHDRIHRRRSGSTDLDVAYICVPIQISTGDTIGTLAVDRPPDCPLEVDEAQALLVIVATLIAHQVHLLREGQRQRDELNAENTRLRAALGEQLRPQNMIGSAGRMRQVFAAIGQVAPSQTTVLIRGASGTGKELVASAIHYASQRHERPFVRVNCAALNEQLLESELFGHEQGAFTGATQHRSGRLEEAEGGTLFLDEIGEFSATIQVKLLRFLQEREYQRVGSNQTRRADVRIITATNRDLEAAVADGIFRDDLYYRINVFPVHLPDLCDRREDILDLANHFVAKYAAGVDKRVTRISTSAIDMLLAYHWPGNVRELENCIQYALVCCSDGVIRGRDLPPTLQLPERRGHQPIGSLSQQVELLERDLITDALKRSDGNAAAAARELGITARILRYKIKQLGIRSE